MNAAVTGAHAIKCVACGLDAGVPEPWMDFCAGCAQAVFENRQCRLCKAAVVITSDPSGKAGRLFIHDGGQWCHDKGPNSEPSNTLEAADD